MLKTCFKCSVEKPSSEFYKHSQMKDGFVGKCKECNKADVTANRNRNLDKYRKYDRVRGNRQDASYCREYRDKYPRKYKAHTLVGNYVRDGKLSRGPCEVCGEVRSVAHHDDYNKPLVVRWFCQSHHKQWHVVNGEGLNGD